MAQLPVITAQQAIYAFRKFGFEEIRQRGSHRILAKPNHRFILSIPDHGSPPLRRGLLRSLITTAGVTVDEFVAALA